MKIIIFGSNGMLGTYLTKFLSTNHEVIPVTRKNIDLSLSTEIQIIDFLSNLVGENDLIINSAGIIKQRQYDINEMILVNSVFPNILSKFKKKIKCNIIHITTDCVFDGYKGNYNESDIHDCIDDYGKTKSLGENKELTIIRTSIIGEEINNKKSLVEWVKSNSNKSVDGYSNHLWNGVTCLELAKFIDELILKNNFWSGVNHIFSPNTVSKYELVSIINEVYNLNITIDKKETEKKCFRNLSTLGTPFIKKDLYNQIVDMKNFKIN